MLDSPAYLTRETTEDVIMRTTFDPRLQAATEAAVARYSRPRCATGLRRGRGGRHVRRWRGARDGRWPQHPQVGEFNRAVQAVRQTGSAFKPFLFAAALENGFQPFDIVEDAPLTINTPGSGPWSPRNYDGEFRGFVTMTEAMANSLNTPAVRISEAMGRDRVREVANAFGLRSELAEGPGAGARRIRIQPSGHDRRLCRHPERGQHRAPFGIEELKLLGDDTPLFGVSTGIGDRVISESSARMLTWMMSRVIEDGPVDARSCLAPGRGQDRHDTSGPRRVVHWLYRRLCHRGVDGQ